MRRLVTVLLLLGNVIVWSSATMAAAAPPSSVLDTAQSPVLAAGVLPTAPGALVPLSPTRLVDTRTGLGSLGPLRPGASLSVSVAGHAGVPATGADSVVLNATAVLPGAAGELQVYADGTASPAVGGIAFLAGRTTANLMIVKIGLNGRIRITNYSSGVIQVVADVDGYDLAGYASQDGMYVPVPPTRLDTRAVGGNNPTGMTDSVRNLIQDTPLVRAVVLRLTVRNPVNAGYLVAWTAGQSQPNTSTVNFGPHETVSNLAVVGVDANDQFQFAVPGQRDAEVDVDVVGYFRHESPAGVAGELIPTASARLLDTRIAHAPVPAGRAISVPMLGHAGVPASNVSAVLVNLVAVNPAAPGNLTVYPGPGAVPQASTINFDAGHTVANLAMLRVGADGAVRIADNSPRPVDVVLDLVGYVVDLDLVAPAPVDEVNVVATAPTALTLQFSTWTDDVNADFSGIQIRRAPGSVAPATPTSGTLIADVPVGTHMLTDSGLTTDQTYSYALFAHDRAGNSAAPITITGTPTSVTVTGSDVLRLTGSGAGMVACASTSLCLSHGFAWYRFDGSRWTEDASGPVPKGSPRALTCARGTSFCAFADSGSTWFYDNGVWSASPAMPGVGSADVQLACPAAQRCTEIRRLSNGQLLASSFDGTSWTTPQSIGLDGNDDRLTCAGPDFCAALSETGEIAYQRAGQWTSPTDDLQTIGIAGFGLPSISCAASTFCVASNGRTAATYNGQVWRGSTVFPSVGTSSESMDCVNDSFCLELSVQPATFNGTTWTSWPLSPRLGSVSCVSATWCVGIDYGSRAILFDGHAWTPTAFVGHRQGDLVGASCPTADFCAAVDQTGNVLFRRAGTWSDRAPLTDEPAQLTDWKGVSCTSATQCLAIGDSFRSVYDGTGWTTSSFPADFHAVSVSCGVAADRCLIGSADGRVIGFDGTSFAASVTVGAAVPVHVSCLSASFCAAITGNREVSTFDGAGWSTPVVLAPDRAIGLDARAFACATATRCVTDVNDSMVEFDPGTGAVKFETVSRVEFSVGVAACVPDSFCVAADSSSTLMFDDGSGWTTAVRMAGPGLTPAVALSCPDAESCLLLTAQQARTFSRP